jgi:hypothetical protein
VLFGKCNSLVIDECGVFDGRDAGADRILETRRPKLAASSTAALISSGVNSMDFGLLPCVSTAPVVKILM